jgi:alkanesulfonate monooxygenase SsuD/methylene tetrahydromethanopterin reductase-like flavin-dependent oxidoreductase (luciferase family)
VSETAGRRARLGLTLPQFLDDVGPLLAVARASEEVGLDGVFVFDHLFRMAPSGEPRPSHEMAATLGAVIAETRRITIGTLVARVPLRPAAVLAAVFASARRVAGDRIVAGLGAGDRESRAEHAQFGPPYESVAFRVAQLREATDAVRAAGVPVWIGGQHPDVVATALERADGWNRWGGDPAEVTARMAVDAGIRGDGFTTSWGGVVDLPSLTAERLRELLALDVDWVILGARSPGDPADVHRLGELLREATGDGPAAPRPSE